MSDDTNSAATRRTAHQSTGAVFLTAAGLAAALGAASCCALPLLLGWLGLGSAWLLAVAWIAAPHRIALLAVAVVCLAGGGGLLLRYRRAAACAPTSNPRDVRALTLLVSGALSLGIVFGVLGFVYG